MEKYTIVIEETVVGEFEITAESEQEALEEARQEHKKANFVLEPGELQHAKIAIAKPNEDAFEWLLI